jgi:hypothetical protein
LKLLKVNFLENNFSESREAQKAIDKPSPIGLDTLRSGGCHAKRQVRENDVMKKHRKNPERTCCKFRSSGDKNTESERNSRILVGIPPEFAT